MVIDSRKRAGSVALDHRIQLQEPACARQAQHSAPSTALPAARALTFVFTPSSPAQPTVHVHKKNHPIIAL